MQFILNIDIRTQLYKTCKWHHTKFKVKLVTQALPHASRLAPSSDRLTHAVSFTMQSKHLECWGNTVILHMMNAGKPQQDKTAAKNISSLKCCLSIESPAKQHLTVLLLFCFWLVKWNHFVLFTIKHCAIKLFCQVLINVMNHSESFREHRTTTGPLFNRK